MRPQFKSTTNISNMSNNEIPCLFKHHSSYPFWKVVLQLIQESGKPPLDYQDETILLYQSSDLPAWQKRDSGYTYWGKAILKLPNGLYAIITGGYDNESRSISPSSAYIQTTRLGDELLFSDDGFAEARTAERSAVPKT
jgi:hypothetical protein